MSFFACCPDGVRVLGCSQVLELRNLGTGQAQHTLDLPADILTAAAIFADGRRVVVGGGSGLCFRYDAETGRLVGRNREVWGAVMTLTGRPRSSEVLVGDVR